jgi:hypothetical protein
MSNPVSGLSRRFNFGKSAALPLNFGVATACPLEVEPSNAPNRPTRRSPFLESVVGACLIVRRSYFAR